MDRNLALGVVGVAVLILAARGSLKSAWSTLLGGAAGSTAQITPTGQTLCHFSTSNTDICTESAAQCTAFGGDPSRPDTLGYCAAGGAGRTSGPPAGAPGSGVTTQ